MKVHKMECSFDTINTKTGFATGDLFRSDQQVREYFSVNSQQEIFGDDAVVDEISLQIMADCVILHKWHMYWEGETRHKLTHLAGETMVMRELLAENEELVALLDAGQPEEICINFINENW